MAAARQVLERSTMMLLTSSKVRQFVNVTLPEERTPKRYKYLTLLLQEIISLKFQSMHSQICIESEV